MLMNTFLNKNQKEVRFEIQGSQKLSPGEKNASRFQQGRNFPTYGGTHREVRESKRPQRKTGAP